MECEHHTWTIEDDGLTCREDRAICDDCGEDISDIVADLEEARAIDRAERELLEAQRAEE